MNTGRQQICGIWFNSVPAPGFDGRWVSDVNGAVGGVVLSRPLKWKRDEESWKVHAGGELLGTGYKLKEAVYFNEAAIRKALGL